MCNHPLSYTFQACGPVVSNPRATAYGVTKTGMVELTRSLALELARQSITVNAIAPG